MRTRFTSCTILAATASVIALSSSGALAEAASAPATAPDVAAPATPLGEIVVTAERRDSTVQKTPIAIAVYNGAQLEKQGVSDLRGLTAIAPNLNIATSAGQSVVTIRGISSRDTTEVGDPAVAVDVDGFYNNRPYGLNASLFDLERIEVLRGPQGTLNGRNAVGGAINIVTAKPTNKLEGSASLSYGNYNALEARAMVNVPISDKVQVRAAFLSASHNGYRNNAPSRNGDDDDTKAGRLSFAFEPTDRLKGLIELEYIKIGGVGQSLYNTPLLTDADGAVTHARPTLPADGKTWPLYIGGQEKLDQKTLRWQFDYDLSGVKLTWLGGYQGLSWLSTADLSTAGKPRQFVQTEHPATQNQEFRIASDNESRLTWQAGVFYFREDSHLFSYNNFPSAAGDYTGFAFRYGPIVSRSIAGYGQASFALTDSLKLTGGLRYSDDKKSRSGGFLVPLDTTPPVDYLPFYSQSEGHWHKLTWHAAADWQVTSRNLLYAKADTGYKAGGFDDIGPYNPEFVTAYEIGSKNRFADGKLELNLSAFYNDYKNQQVSQLIVIGTNAGATHVQNAGSSHIKGIEMDAVAALGALGRLNLTVDYLDAKFHNFIATTPDGSANVDFSGSRLPQSPKWTIAAGFEHVFELASGTLTARVQTKYVSTQYFAYYNYADVRQKGYTNTDLMLSYTPAEKAWSVDLFVHNIENKFTLAFAEENYLTNTNRYAFNAPRTYGGRVSFHF